MTMNEYNDVVCPHCKKPMQQVDSVFVCLTKGCIAGSREDCWGNI